MPGSRLLSLMLLTVLGSPAFAGDYAERTVLGFSPDARYFAFIEHGVQDGSGFPFANAYVIDTSTDAWLPGTPVRILDEADGASADDAITQALNGIAPLVDKHQIGSPASVVAYTPLTETSSDPHLVSFLRRMIVPPDMDAAYTLSLDEKPLPAAGCPDMGHPFVGFTLTLTSPSGASVVLADDDKLPASRKCPLAYRISEVMFAPDSPVFAVLVDVMQVGFEGPDRRFLAVTGTAPD